MPREKSRTGITSPQTNGATRSLRSGKREAITTTADPHPYVSPSAPELTAPPRRLTATTLDDFLMWVSRLPRGRTREIPEYLARCSPTPKLLRELHSSLLAVPVADFGRHLLLLATIGELRHPSSIEPLTEFIWRSTSEDQGGDGQACFGPPGALEGRAAEMLAFISTDTAETAVRRIIADHPLRPVRAAAIDAYLFTHGDTSGARAAIEKSVRVEDRPLMDVVRWTRDTDAKALAERVHDFYRKHPKQLPPQPERLVRRTRPSPRAKQVKNTRPKKE